jgi:hypothetical protein
MGRRDGRRYCKWAWAHADCGAGRGDGWRLLEVAFARLGETRGDASFEICDDIRRRMAVEGRMCY